MLQVPGREWVTILLAYRCSWQATVWVLRSRGRLKPHLTQSHSAMPCARARERPTVCAGPSRGRSAGWWSISRRRRDPSPGEGSRTVLAQLLERPAGPDPAELAAGARAGPP